MRRSFFIQEKKLFLLIFFVAVCQQSFSQSKDVMDSIILSLKTKTKDTIQLRILNDLITNKEKIYTAIKDPNSKDYAINALALAEKIGFAEGKAFSNLHISAHYYYKGNYSEAIKYMQEALKIFIEIGNKVAEASLNTGIAYCYYHVGNYGKALEKYAISLKLIDEIGDYQMKGDCYNFMGHTYRNMGDYKQAMECHLNAMKIGEEIGVKALVAKGSDGMGLVYMPLGNYSEALKCFQLGMSLWQGLNHGEVYGSYNRLGRVYAKLGNYKEALKNCRMALNFFREKGEKYSTAVSYNNIGDIYFFQSKYQEALKNYLDGLNLNREIGDKYRLALNYLNVGKSYIGLNNCMEAKQYLLNALTLSKETGDKENLKNIFENLSMVDSALGNYKQSLTYHKLYSHYKDSILNETNNKQITQLKEQYESDKKDKEIELLNRGTAIRDLQLKKQREAKNYLIAGISLLAVLSFFLYRNYRTRQQLKLQTLRNKIAIDLHDDIGSTLSSISIFSQMAQGQSKETIPLLETIGESSRKMLDAMADIVWTINPENDQFEKIISRMKGFAFELLGARNIDFEFEADEEVEKLKLPMEVRKNLYLIFKEATNNMVKYAQAKNAKFTINGVKNNLTMMIRDNGKGFDINKNTDGNGLKNMKKRAAEIGAEIFISSGSGSGTTIKLSVPV